jgi:NADH:ubiquinone oxidoreductase subunit 5 (subunit L)/multisubunit Na+/H+ antiporter MnhA subunit
VVVVVLLVPAHCFKRPAATAVSIRKAFITNRWGSNLLEYSWYDLLTLNISEISIQATAIDFKIFTSQKFSKYTINRNILLLGGCIAKSAQFPLQVHCQMPCRPHASIEHAATMVAAGLF